MTNTVATIFPHCLTFEEIIKLPEVFTNPQLFPTLIRVTRATEPDQWVLPLYEPYATLHEQWLDGEVYIESPRSAVTLSFRKHFCILDGWMSFHRFLVNDDSEINKAAHRALCQELAKRLNVEKVLHCPFSEIPWDTLDEAPMDIDELRKLIERYGGCILDDFKTFVIYPE